MEEAFLMLFQSPLLQALGVKGVCLSCSKGEEQFRIFVYDLETLNRTLVERCIAGFIEADDVGLLNVIGKVFELPPTWADVAKTVRQFTLPAGHKSEFVFQLCDCDVPLPHGVIANVTNESLTSDKYPTLMEGLDHCLELVERKFSPLDLADAFRQMLEADLPIDEEDFKKRYLKIRDEAQGKPPSVPLPN